MSDREWDATCQLVRDAHDDVRRLQARGQLILGAGLAAGGVSIPIVGHAPDVGFAMSELLITFAFAWHMNLNADAAAIAEVRDFLAERLNADTRGKPFRFKATGDVGRSHPATLLAGILPAFVLIGFIVGSGLNAFRQVDWHNGRYLLPDWAAMAVWIVVTSACVVGFVAAGRAVSDYRQSMRDSLWGPDPLQARPSFCRRIFNMLFRRDDQGWSWERAVARDTTDDADPSEDPDAGDDADQ